MNRAELAELHNITPISNVASIRVSGILCHTLAEGVRHDSVAMAEMQDRRARVVVPGGRPLHRYANLYINGRNKLMFKITRHGDLHLCVLSVSTEVLDLAKVVISDQNAASSYVRFAPSPRGLDLIDRERVFAESWVHSDPIATWRHGSVVCAEVLVPDRVDPKYILGAYVSCEESRARLEAVAPGLPVVIDAHLFFR